MPETARPRRRRPRTPEETRRRLLGSAGELFAARGYSGARTDALAAAAGVNKALISYHFGGKAGLFRAVMAEVIAAARPGIDAVMQDEMPAADRLRQWADFLAGFLDTRPEFAPLLLRQYLDGAADLDDASLDTLATFYRTTEAILAQGVAEGAFRSVNPHDTHLALVGALVFFQASLPVRSGHALADVEAASRSLSAFAQGLAERLLSGIARTHRGDSP